MAEEYEKYIRDMQVCYYNNSFFRILQFLILKDKIDEQNQTINSLRDQMDSRRESILNSTRIEPDGEEGTPENHEIQSDEEFHYENALKLHDNILSSTPKLTRHMPSVADELPGNRLCSKSLGELLTLTEEKDTQTTVEMTSQETSCEIPTQTELKQKSEMNEMEERHGFLSCTYF